MYHMVIGLNCSTSLSYWFNFGSMLGMVLMFQLMSGLLLLMNYNSYESYESVMFITMEVNFGWMMKIFHSNNASLIFLVMYMHLYKAMMMTSWRLSKVWYTGLLMMLMIMGAAFSGYVLVGSQMSLWAAMVITSLISVFPMNGESLMYFIWGGYSISWITLQTLMLVHFILPFCVLLVMVLHLTYLHSTGSTSLVYLHSSIEKTYFFPFFWVKDMINLVWFFMALVLMFLYPYSLGEVELYEESNFLVSPAHIVPEWYFTAQYAILRSVPSKSMGVILMIMSLGVLFFYPMFSNYMSPFSLIGMSMMLVMFGLQFYLSYLGFSPISQPFILVSMLSMYCYFMFHLINLFIMTISMFFFMVF